MRDNKSQSSDHKEIKPKMASGVGWCDVGCPQCNWKRGDGERRYNEAQCEIDRFWRRIDEDAEVCPVWARRTAKERDSYRDCYVGDLNSKQIEIDKYASRIEELELEVQEIQTCASCGRKWVGFACVWCPWCKADRRVAELEAQLAEAKAERAAYGDKMTSKLGAAEAQLATMRKFQRVLAGIANDGCGLCCIKDGEHRTCLDLHPDDKSEWCWSCIARVAVHEARKVTP